MYPTLLSGIVRTLHPQWDIVDLLYREPIKQLKQAKDVFKIQTPKQPQYEPKSLNIDFDISKDTAAGFLLLVGIACLAGGVIALKNGLPSKLDAKIGTTTLFIMGGLITVIAIDELFLDGKLENWWREKQKKYHLYF